MDLQTQRYLKKRLEQGSPPNAVGEYIQWKRSEIALKSLENIKQDSGIACDVCVIFKENTLSIDRRFQNHLQFGSK